ncbi:MAG: YdeI/OmpD-associated family protein [Candidatus Aminicenantes bacterium]|nr:YdeI/OmpD-associated family protein [Candidatus Aminicenantes bacterium]
MLERYRSLSYSHQREYALWIDAAKQAETRWRRIEKSITALRSQKKPQS